MRNCWVAILLLVSALSLAAQEFTDSQWLALRPPRIIFSAELGYSQVRDSYLSPVTYDGPHFSVGLEHHQVAGFGHGRWVRQLNVDFAYDYGTNPAGNHHEHTLMVEARWSPMRRWDNALWHQVSVSVGPMIGARGGAIYNPHNSNNVVAGHGHLAIGAQGSAEWSTHLWRRTIDLRYQATVPVVGVFFSPDYDEAYYEIYLGNHSGLAHCGWWGNRLDLGHSITADVHFGSTILRLGYRGTWHRSDVNHLKARTMSHSLVIGLGGDFLSVKLR